MNILADLIFVLGHAAIAAREFWVIGTEFHKKQGGSLAGSCQKLGGIPLTRRHETDILLAGPDRGTSHAIPSIDAAPVHQASRQRGRDRVAGFRTRATDSQA